MARPYPLLITAFAGAGCGITLLHLLIVADLSDDTVLINCVAWLSGLTLALISLKRTELSALPLLLRILLTCLSIVGLASVGVITGEELGRVGHYPFLTKILAICWSSASGPLIGLLYMQVFKKEQIQVEPEPIQYSRKPPSSKTKPQQKPDYEKHHWVEEVERQGHHAPWKSGE